ncbi:peptidyl-prolyl cis-trans isomerase [Paenibacillus agricola]|uniref:peptidylprolyl isomerase n=1 Tax=Paenibacillus agricola TaxID=2716264 RepID=A0ABX0JLW0_9BACL|nr:peptidyl-prolyl cis-trans isomerase [Paenibacillus agricola]NHN35055.1 peptidylprolyl isomerase [Paenibacillus agricola]
MRNVKILWGVNALLLLVVVILSSVLFAALFNKPLVEAKPEQTKPAGRIIATIGEKTITSEDLKQQLLQKHGRELLDQMVDHEVIGMEGHAEGISVEESEINKELKRMQQGYDSEQQFYESMKEQLGFSEEALRTDVYSKLLLEKLATRSINITNEQVDAYIKAHPDEFKAPVLLRIQQIVVSSQANADKVALDLSKGMDFSQVAKDRSLDDATRNKGGDLGWLDEDDPFMVPVLLNAAKQLKVGEVSKPISFNGNIYFIKLRERQEDSKAKQDELKEVVRKEMALREAPPLKEVILKLRERWKVSITF